MYWECKESGKVVEGSRWRFEEFGGSALHSGGASRSFLKGRFTFISRSLLDHGSLQSVMTVTPLEKCLAMVSRVTNIAGWSCAIAALPS